MFKSACEAFAENLFDFPHFHTYISALSARERAARRFRDIRRCGVRLVTSVFR